MKIFKIILISIILTFISNAKEISIATYNVENLFDSNNDGSEYKEYVKGRYGWNKKMADIKLKNTLQVIKTINADIIALQEIENKTLMKTLANKLNYKYYSFAKPKKSPFGVGVLSKFLITEEKSFRVPGVKTRDILHVKIKIENKQISFWINHWPTQKSPYQSRITTLNTLKDAILKHSEKEYIVLGDFNTALKENSITSKFLSNRCDIKSLYNPWYELPYKKRYSYKFFGRKFAPDSIFLSKTMFDNTNFDYKRHSFKVVDFNFLKNKYDEPYRWQIDKKGKGKHLGKGYSDHFPLMLKITTKANPAKVKSIKELKKSKNNDVNVLLKNVSIENYKKGYYFYDNFDKILMPFAPCSLEEGQKYNIIVNKLNDYKGKKEILSFWILNKN